MVPVTALTMVVSTQAVAILFLQGRFEPSAAAATGELLVVFAVGLAAHAMVAILAPAFYAGRDTVTPVVAAVVAVAVNVAVAVALVGPYGLRGLAAAITAGAWVEALLLLVLLGRRFPEIHLGALARSLAVVLPGALAAGLAALVVLAWLDGPGPLAASKVELAVRLVLAGAAAGGVFLAYAALLRLDELHTLRLILAEVARPRRAAP
jgi:putative peptidoglycan lipid II flippase